MRGWWPRGARRPDPDRGMVTAELAATIPTLIFVLLIAINAVLIGINQVRCVDAARVAARAAARGDTPAAVQEVGARAGPPGSTVSVAGGGEAVTVTVSAPVPGPFGWLAGGQPLRSSVTTPVESTGPAS